MSANTPDPAAVFFITTARSGTQWVRHALGELFPDQLEVEHEPIHYAYESRRCLRNPGVQREVRERPVVASHLERIHRTLETKTYVEVGFPSYGMIPLLAEEFGPRLRLVHYLRHPIKVAASLLTLGFYDPEARPELDALISPYPSDGGVGFPALREQWSSMSRFERALYYWAEVHAYGLELEKTLPETPFCRVRFEDLLRRPDEQQKLTRFLGVRDTRSWSELERERTDHFQYRTKEPIPVDRAHRFSGVVTLAATFGYALDEVSQAEVNSRYRVSRLRVAARRARRRLGALLRLA